MLLFVGFISFVIYKGLEGFGIHKDTAIAFSYATFFMVISTFGILGKIEEESSSAAGFMTLGMFLCAFWIALKFGGRFTNALNPSGEGASLGAPSEEEGTSGFIGRLVHGAGQVAGTSPLTPSGEENISPEAKRAAAKAFVHMNRSDKMAMLEVSQVEDFKKSIAKGDTPDVIVGKAKTLVEKLLREEKREEAFVLKAKTYAENLQKALDEMGEKDLSKFTTKDAEKAFIFANKAKDELEKIKTKIENAERTPPVAQNNADEIVADIEGVEKMLTALIAVDDEALKKLTEFKKKA